MTEDGPRTMANYWLFIVFIFVFYFFYCLFIALTSSHDLLEKIPPKKKKRADDILRYAESKFYFKKFVAPREFSKGFTELAHQAIHGPLPRALSGNVGCECGDSLTFRKLGFEELVRCKICPNC